MVRHFVKHYKKMLSVVKRKTCKKENDQLQPILVFCYVYILLNVKSLVFCKLVE